MSNTDRDSMLERWADGMERLEQYYEGIYGPPATPPSLPPITTYDAMLEAIADGMERAKRNINKKSPTYHSDSVAYVKTVPSGDVHYASLEQIGGKTLVWNQLVDSGTTTVATISGHKYYTLIDGTASIVTADGTAITIVDDSADMVTDLTLCYGSGNEPSTVAEFTAQFPASYYSYNAGTLLSEGVTEVKSVGINVWDEQWEVGGINSTDGQNNSLTDRIRSKNYIPVQSGVNYYFSSLPSTENMLVYCYTFDKKYTGTYWYRNVNQPINTIPQDVCYVRFNMVASYGTTYRNDICIHVSDASTNGKYYPYNAHTYPIPASIQALEGYGWSAGSVYNYIDYEAKKFIQNVASVDLSTLTWGYGPSVGWSATLNAKNPADDDTVFNGVSATLTPVTRNAQATAFSGGTDAGMVSVSGGKVYVGTGDIGIVPSGTLYYELDEPVETDISAYLADDGLIEVEVGGTLEFPNQNGNDYRIPVPSAETFVVGEP